MGTESGPEAERDRAPVLEVEGLLSMPSDTLFSLVVRGSDSAEEKTLVLAGFRTPLPLPLLEGTGREWFRVICIILCKIGWRSPGEDEDRRWESGAAESEKERARLTNLLPND